MSKCLIPISTISPCLLSINFSKPISARIHLYPSFQTTRYAFHFPLSHRMLKTTARNSQSHTIASHTPSAPIPKIPANRYAAPMRKIHMDTTDIIMVNLTSPAARMDAGRTKVSDQIKTAPAVCINTICEVSSAVACDK